VHDQDRALAENSRSIGNGNGNPGIADRSQEHLVSSDRAVVAARRILLNLSDQLAQGAEPELLKRPELFAVRAISKLTPIDNFDDFMAEFGAELAAAPAPAAQP
jgi:phthalate 4,5-dioxygenase